MNAPKNESKRRRWTRKQRQGMLGRFHESQLTQSDDFRGNPSQLSKFAHFPPDSPAPSGFLADGRFLPQPPKVSLTSVLIEIEKADEPPAHGGKEAV